MKRTLPYTNIWTDSRKVTKGSLFVCLSNSPIAEIHIKQALRKGATSILRSDGKDISGKLTKLLQKSYPIQKSIEVIAVTGTDGKSSVVHFCRELAGSCGYKSASIGTLGVFITDTQGTKRLFPGTLTTPDQCTTFQYLHKLSELGVKFVFIEYSSIGIHQNRLAGIPIFGGVFTTFGTDHLDYHKPVAITTFLKEAERYTNYIRLLPEYAGIFIRSQYANQPTKQELYIASKAFILKRDNKPHIFRVSNYNGKAKKKDGLTLSVVRCSSDRLLGLNDRIAFERVV